MFYFITSQRGKYNLNGKVLLWIYISKKNCCFYFQRKKAIQSFSNHLFSCSTNIFTPKHLYNLKNETNQINYYYQHCFLYVPFRNKTIATTKEYILNAGNEFEQVKTNSIQQENEETHKRKKILPVVSKEEKKRNETKQNEETAQTEYIKNKMEKEITEEFEESEEKLQRLLRKRKIQKNILTITDEAMKEIKRIIEIHNKENKNNDDVLKLYFITKGCNGLTHSLQFISKNEIMKNDEIIYDKEKKILLVVDSQCVLFVINTKLDFYRDEISERFVFSNPNITSMCPCGTSFHFSKDNTDEDE